MPESINIPPLILVSKKDGDLINSAAQKFLEKYQDTKAIGDEAVHIYIDFDMVSSIITLTVLKC